MLAKRIIPCLDVDQGRVVKGIRFISLIDAGDPVEQGKRYDAEGADELTFLDITASSDRRDIVAALVRRVADEVFIPFTVGGGLRSLEDIRAVLRSGADKVSLNTAAIEQPQLISEGAETFGSQCMIVAVDARRRDAADPTKGWEVFTLAYMNAESLSRTLETNETWFWSRSRSSLWHKGETSGSKQTVVGISVDCDHDALRVLVVPAGPACHTGAQTCFHHELQEATGEGRAEAGAEDIKVDLGEVLKRLYVLIESRNRERPEGSYTTYLFDQGLTKFSKS